MVVPPIISDSTKPTSVRVAAYRLTRALSDKMPLPRGQFARQFYRAGKQRFDDARLLLEAARTTGAIYLAGYGVECFLKAMILSLVPDDEQPDVERGFRSATAHRFDWLRRQYFQRGGPQFPPEIASAFVLVNTWGTEWRYRSGVASQRDATDFLDSAEQIIVWADSRI